MSDMSPPARSVAATDRSNMVVAAAALHRYIYDTLLVVIAARLPARRPTSMPMLSLMPLYANK